MNHRLPLLVLLFVTSSAFAQAPLPTIDADPTVVGQLEHEGQALIGSRGRHYLFGGLAVADYADSAGQRRIVTLKRQDEINDANFTYYRELRDGHRWALAKTPVADGTYGVWIQVAAADAATKPRWLPFHRARRETPVDEMASAASLAYCCGN